MSGNSRSFTVELSFSYSQKSETKTELCEIDKGNWKENKSYVRSTDTTLDIIAIKYQRNA